MILINFYDILINIKNAKYNFLNQYLVIYKNLMASEAQYYQAKVFLKSYNEALQTLEYYWVYRSDVHRNQALLAKNLAYKDFIVGGHGRG